MCIRVITGRGGAGLLKLPYDLNTIILESIILIIL